MLHLYIVITDKQEQLLVLDVLTTTTVPDFVISFFLCPYFVLSRPEYNSIIYREFRDTFRGNQTEITKYTYIIDGVFPLSKNNIAVCVDSYFGLFEKNGCPSRSVLFSQGIWIFMEACRAVSPESALFPKVFNCLLQRNASVYVMILGGTIVQTWLGTCLCWTRIN